MEFKKELIKTKLISIIVPTTRPENETLESFFQFNVPNDYNLEYIFIIDDPSKKLDNLIDIIKNYPQFNIEIIKNKENLGTSASRNIGIKKSKGDFILSLDDDCLLKPNLIEKYIKAYIENPDYPGYIGLTNAPEPKTSFDKAINLSDMRHFFEIAKHKNEFFWGITANLFLKSEAIGDIYFSSEHPKKGGGEDIAFCLEILKSHNYQGNRIFKCVPEAEVVHPYWKENLSGYKRFLRWGYGDVVLHKRFPQYRFHQYPNLIEFTIIALILNLIIFSFFYTIPNWFMIFWIILLLLFLEFIWEIICEAIKLHKNKRKFNLVPLIKAVIIRQLNDMGRFFGQFPKIWKITCRWDYFCTRESLKYETKTAFMKFLGFLSIYIFLVLIMIIFYK